MGGEKLFLPNDFHYVGCGEKLLKVFVDNVFGELAYLVSRPSCVGMYCVRMFSLNV